jgi:hypothetical protein
MGGSANWGRLYNPLSLRQILDYCEDSAWRPRERWWIDTQGRTCDPFRAVSAYDTEEIAEADFSRHQVLARNAFEAADIVILTYGLAEVWESRLDGSVFSSRPIAFEPSRHGFRLLDYVECIGAIEATCRSIHHINPRAEIILTVSPVPLRATFRSEVNPVTANVYSKAVLLAAVQTASQRIDHTTYFPSYDIVMECLDDPVDSRGQVTTRAVSMVMDVFERQMVQS